MNKPLLTFGSALAIAALSAGAAFAQFSGINGAVVNRDFVDDSLSIFTPVVNYPTQIILSDQAVNMSTAKNFGNRDVFRLSDDGGKSAFQFSDTNFFNISFTVNLQGNARPRKEAGFLIGTQYGEGQFIVNSDAGEIVVFNGPFPFYSFNVNYKQTYTIGTTVTLGLTYFQDTDGINKIVYHATTADGMMLDSPALSFDPTLPGIFNGGTIGGYLQVPIDTKNPTNGAMATFQNIAIAPVGNTLVSGTLAFEGISSTAGNQMVTFTFRSTTGAAPFTRTTQVPASGVFTLTNIRPDKYDVLVKGTKYLAQLVSVDNSSAPATGIAVNQRAGDANNDNSVDSTDFGLLIGAFNTSAAVPNSGYDATVDFNSDGAVDSTDFGLLIGEFNNMGDK